jgi:CHAT domain/PASTA domain
LRALRYTDFDLRIERGGTGYVARVLESPAGEATSTFTLPFTPDKIENLILKIGRRLGAAVRGVHASELEAAREFGGSLFDALFTGSVRDCYARSLDQVSRAQDAGLRFRLRLQDVPELADLPWEFLLDQSRGRFLAQSVQTPVIRYMEMPEGVRPFPITLPLRVLVMISAPSDEQQLNLPQERARLEQAFKPLLDQGKLEVTWLEDATLDTLRRLLQKDEYHIFHFVGHGAFDPKREIGVLILEDEHERALRTEADRIGTVLFDHTSLRLAVLNSCEGARNSRSDPFAGVAANLVRQGIPAVVAMQFEISDDAAITFAGEFYHALAEGFSVDTAVAEARKAIYTRPNDVEWATPVLYMRSPTGVLFKFDEQEAAARRSGNKERRLPDAPVKRVSVTSPEPTPTKRKKWLKYGMIGGAMVVVILIVATVVPHREKILPPAQHQPPPPTVPRPNVTRSRTMPTVVGRTFAAAESLLNAKKVSVVRRDTLNADTTTYQANVVIEQHPAAGSKLTSESSLDTLLVQLPFTVVPAVVRQKPDVAANKLGLAGLQATGFQRCTTDSSLQNVVLATAPAAGTLLGRNSTVTVYVGFVQTTCRFRDRAIQFERLVDPRVLAPIRRPPDE